MIPELTIEDMTRIVNAEWTFAAEVRFDPESIAQSRDGDFVQALCIWQVRLPQGGWEGQAEVLAFKYKGDPINEWRLA